MTEGNKPNPIRHHPDSGRQLSEEESQEITSYNANRTNFAIGSESGVTKFTKPKELLAEPFD